MDRPLTRNSDRTDAIVGCLIDFGGDKRLEARLRAACSGDARLLEHRPERVLANAKALTKVLRVTPRQVVGIGVKAPFFLYRKPASIAANLKALSILFGTSRAAMVRMGLNRPEILLLSPPAVKTKIADTARFLEINENDYCRLCRGAPSLIGYSPEAVFCNATGVAEALDIELAEVCRLALRKPVILLKSPEGLAVFIDQFGERFRLTTRTVRHIIKRYPGLVFQKIETFERNIERLAALTGLKWERVIHAASKLPPLFYLNPAGVIGKFEDAARRLDVDRAVLFRAFDRMPTLAGRDPVKLARRVRIAGRMAILLGGPHEPQDILRASPAVPTYGTQRLLLRLLVARLDLWRGKWTSLIALPDSRVRDRLEDYLAELAPGSLAAMRLRRLIDRRLPNV